jgi:hypothetical protein
MFIDLFCFLELSCVFLFFIYGFTLPLYYHTPLSSHPLAKQHNLPQCSTKGTIEAEFNSVVAGVQGCITMPERS